MNNQNTLKNGCFQLWRAGKKQRTITTMGQSMAPLITEGSQLTFVPCLCDRKMRIGDIALFERDNKLIAHRIIGHCYQNGSLWYREKGDNAFATGVFPAESLIGRIIRVEHKGIVRDLTGRLSRIMGRSVGTYWAALFFIVRAVLPVKRWLFSVSEMPCLRECALAIVRFLNRIPTRFTKR